MPAELIVPGASKNVSINHPGRAMLRRTVIGLLLSALASQPLLAAEKVFSRGGAAIRGYDPVAYHLEMAPVKGDSKYSYEWKGHEWRFKDAANRDRFIADPEKYAPRYNGFCAWAASQGYLASTVPDAWTIRDGKLYLNYSLSVRSTWLKDVDANIAAGNRNWPDLKQ